jgi:LysR family transcriptional regulator for metE and metH
MHMTHELDDALRPLTLELRHLRLVLAIHEQGSVTGAGSRLHLTQSALSHQLQEIEDRLQVQLFRRVRRRLVLSEAGERLLEAARRILGDVVALEDDLRDRAAERRGRLRLTTECYTVYEWLPPVLARFGRRFPGIDVHIVAEATARPLAAVLDGEVDLALVTRVPATAAVQATPLFTDELLLATAPRHRLAHRSHVKPKDLEPETLILYSEPAASFFYQQFLAGTDHAPRVVQQVGLTEAMLSMIRAGLGVGVFARWAIQADLQRRTLAGVRIGPRGLHREWRALRRRRETSAALDHFVDVLCAEAAASADRPRRRAG